MAMRLLLCFGYFISCNNSESHLLRVNPRVSCSAKGDCEGDCDCEARLDAVRGLLTGVRLTCATNGLVVYMTETTVVQS